MFEKLMTAMKLLPNDEKYRELEAILTEIKKHNALAKQVKQNPQIKSFAQLRLDNEIDLSPALITALQQGDFASANLLLDYGADLLKIDNSQPFKLVAEQGNIDCLTLLLNQPHLKKDQATLGEALILAAEKGHLEFIRKLLDSRLVPVDYQTPKPRLGSRLTYGTTALMTACQYGHPEVVRHLIEDRRANIHIKCSKQSTAFFFIFITGVPFKKENYIECARLLLRAGVDPKAIDKYGVSAIHRCVQNLPELLPFLLQLGLDPNATDKREAGVTPLNVAVNQNNLDAARTLLEHGADPDIRTAMCNLVHASNKSKEMVMLLVKSGCDLDISIDGSPFMGHVKRSGFNYTTEELKIIEAAAKLKALDEALATKQLLIADHLITSILKDEPTLFIGFMRQCINRRKVNQGPCLFLDGAYQYMILKVLSAVRNTPEIYNTIVLIIAQDLYSNNPQLRADERKLFALLFLMEGKGHPRFKEHPAARIARELMAGNRAVPESDQPLRQRFPAESQRLDACLANLKKMLFSPEYLTDLTRQFGKQPHLIVSKAINHIRGVNAPLVLPQASTELELILNEEGKLHSIHQNPTSHNLFKRLRAYTVTSWHPLGFLGRTNFSCDIAQITQQLLAINFGAHSETIEIKDLLAHIERLEQRPDYQKELATAPENSLPGIFKAIKIYLMELKAPENSPVGDIYNDASL